MQPSPPGEGVPAPGRIHVSICKLARANPRSHLQALNTAHDCITYGPVRAPPLATAYSGTYLAFHSITASPLGDDTQWLVPIYNSAKGS